MIRNRWIIPFLILPHLQIYYFDNDFFRPIILIWQSLILVIALVLVFKELNIFNIIFSIFVCVILFSAYWNGYLTISTCYTMAILVAFCVYIFFESRKPLELITGLFYLFIPLVLLNFASVIVGGLGINYRGSVLYLLGGKNNIIFTILPAITITYMYSLMKFNKLKIFPFIIIIISLLSVFVAGSGTGIVVVLLTILVILLPKHILPQYFTYIIIYFTAFLAIIILRLQEKLFGDFIVNVLKKDITFTGRTQIWDTITRALNDSWLLGKGLGNSVVIDSFYPINQEHNLLLQIALDSGIIGIVLFTFLLILVGKELKKSNFNYYTKVISFSVFAYLVVGLQESILYRKEFWLLLVISYASNKMLLKMDLSKKIN